MLKHLFSSDHNKSDDERRARPTPKPVTPSSGPVLTPSPEAEAGQNMARRVIAAADALSEPTVSHPGVDLARSITDRVAIEFANDQTRMAIDHLVNVLNESKGQVDEPVWFMLLDAYQATDQQGPFEKLATFFAKRFKRSPPPWERMESGRNDLNGGPLGRNVLVIDGSPSLLKKEKVQDFLSAIDETRNCKIDLSRLKLSLDEPSWDVDVRRITRTLAAVRRRAQPSVLMGDAHVASTLQAWLEAEAEASNQTALWHLLFELMMWRNDQDRFETMGLAYARRFGESPPSYEPHPRANDAKPTAEASWIASTGEVVPESIIDAQNVERLITSIDERLKDTGRAWVKCHHVRRMDYPAANALTHFFTKMAVEKSRIVFHAPHQLLIVLFDLTGMSSLITVQPRKR